MAKNRLCFAVKGEIFMFSGIGVTELILILVIALVVFGPGKLPDVGRALGKSIREFKNAERSIVEDVTIEEKKSDSDKAK